MRPESGGTSHVARVIRKASDPGSSERRGYTQTDSQKGIINESYADRLTKRYYSRARRGNTQTDRLTHSDRGIPGCGIVWAGAPRLLRCSRKRLRPHAGFTTRRNKERRHTQDSPCARKKDRIHLVHAGFTARRNEERRRTQTSAPHVHDPD